ncbi:MAG: branched-chain amino acid ABC transporter permease [Lentisphaeria bacterium]|nr:branched-chain amino acid ABC transporter permease [Lentisphaeria bacterium]
MGSFLYTLVDGLCIGSIYALIALGYTMVYGIIKLINFAHGEFFMVGAYSAWGIFLVLPNSLTTIPAMVLTIIVGGLAGASIAVLTEYIAYRPLRNSDRLTTLLTAIGVSFLLQNIFAMIKGGSTQNFRTYGNSDSSSVNYDFDKITSHSIPFLGDQNFQTFKFAFVAITMLLMIFLWFLTMRTRTGRAMRATSQDLNAALLMGIPINKIIMLTFAIGGFFAGVAGTLNGMFYNVYPTMGFMPGLIAFVAAVVGGIGSIPGAVVGGLLIGVIQQLIVFSGVPSGYKDVGTFTLLIIVLVIRPQGLLGKVMKEKV